MFVKITMRVISQFFSANAVHPYFPCLHKIQLNQAGRSNRKPGLIVFYASMQNAFQFEQHLTLVIAGHFTLILNTRIL